MQNNQNELKLRLLLEALDFYRAIIMDAIEVECGDTPIWTHLRSKLLKAFGDRGLANRITEIMRKSSPSTKKEINHLKGSQNLRVSFILKPDGSIYSKEIHAKFESGQRIAETFIQKVSAALNQA